MSDTMQSWAQQFRTEVWTKSNEIDPGDERDWRSLTLGWALGRGMNPKDADSFSRYIRYETDMG